MDQNLRNPSCLILSHTHMLFRCFMVIDATQIMLIDATQTSSCADFGANAWPGHAGSRGIRCPLLPNQLILPPAPNDCFFPMSNSQVLSRKSSLLKNLKIGVKTALGGGWHLLVDVQWMRAVASWFCDFTRRVLSSHPNCRITRLQNAGGTIVRGWIGSLLISVRGNKNSYAKFPIIMSRLGLKAPDKPVQFLQNRIFLGLCCTLRVVPRVRRSTKVSMATRPTCGRSLVRALGRSSFRHGFRKGSRGLRGYRLAFWGAPRWEEMFAPFVGSNDMLSLVSYIKGE